MKYASEILGLMRPYPEREFTMAQIVRAASHGKELTPRQVEAVRKGARRVLEQLIDSGHVRRIGGQTRSCTYAWIGLGHEVHKNTGLLGRATGQYQQAELRP